MRRLKLQQAVLPFQQLNVMLNKTVRPARQNENEKKNIFIIEARATWQNCISMFETNCNN